MIARLLICPLLENRIGEIEKILDEKGVKNPHPDCLYFPSDSKLGILQARKIKNHFAFKSFTGNITSCVLEDASNLTIEAQNALLKTLEELPEDALFILGADSDSKLLPTVLSRCQIVKLHFLGRGGEEKIYQEDLERLINADLPERFEFIEKLKEKEEFLKFMIFYFHKGLTLHPGGVGTQKFIKELIAAEEWAKHNVNIRAILEYLMMVMPSKL